MRKIHGIYPALVTPLTTDGKVDKVGMRKVTRYCLDGGMTGVVVMGSTGEFPAMNETMRQEAIEVVLDETAGKSPVLIGCGEPGTQRTIAQVKHAAAMKADGVLVAVPYYFPLDQGAIMRHYTKVADASELPVIMYNFPQMTKVAIAPDTVAKLADHPNIIGIKDSSGDFVGLQRYLALTEEADFNVMVGNPALGLAGYQMGAAGGIFAGGSLVPKLCVDVYNAYTSGDLAKAIELQKKASRIPLMGAFGGAAGVVKIGLAKLGICGSTTTAPLAINPGQEEKIYSWMRTLGLSV